MHLVHLSAKNNFRTLMSLGEEVHNKVTRFSALAVKEISDHVSNSSRETHSIEDGEVQSRTIPENTVGHTGSGINYTDAQMFRQRLKIKNGVKELWWHLRSRLKRLAQSGVDVDNLLDDFSHQVKTVMIDLERLENHPAIAKWKNQTAEELAQLVQKRFHYLQNPKDCKAARKLICDLSQPCGFGCAISHIGYCFIVAYATQRTVILKPKFWSYYGNNRWDSVFLPLSDTCTKATTSGAMWSAYSEHKLEVKMPMVENLNPRPLQVPLAFPKDLSEKLLAFHEDPFLWWAGQIFKYLLRPNKKMKKYISTKRNKLGFKRPIVGYATAAAASKLIYCYHCSVHVRRTDKIDTEAAFHSIEEYMVHVEEWYQQRAIAIGHEVDEKRVFLATDDHQLLEEAKEK